MRRMSDAAPKKMFFLRDGDRKLLVLSLAIVALLGLISSVFLERQSAEPLDSSPLRGRLARDSSSASEPASAKKSRVAGPVGRPRTGSNPEQNSAAGVCVLRGIVTWSSDSSPAKGVPITILPGPTAKGGRDTKTDTSGRFLFRGLRRAPHRLLMTVQVRPGYELYQLRRVDLSTRTGDTEQRFSLPCCELRGVLVDADGNPVSRAVVSVSGGGKDLYELMTDQSGSFEVSHLPMRGARMALDVMAVKEGMLTLPCSRIVQQNEKLDIRLVLMRPALKRIKIQGVVVDVAGRPVMGARVHLVYLHKVHVSQPASAKGNLDGVSVMSPSITNESGRFSISAVPREHELDLVVVAAGHAGVFRRIVTPASGRLDNISFRLLRGDSTLRGSVVDSTGQIVQGASVKAHDQSWGPRIVATFDAITNDRGEFELPLVPGRKYLVEAGKEGYSAWWSMVSSMKRTGMTLALRLQKKMKASK